MSDNRHRYKLILAYDGTHYSGWQVQPNAKTIQETLEQACAQFLRETISMTGSGRTDAGVHALGQVAHFDVANPVDTYRFLRAANGLLPDDIRVLSIEKVDPTFHARYNAKKKIYHYHLWLDPVMLPPYRFYRLHVRPPFDRAALEEAVRLFVGTHDFTSFANEPACGAVARNPVRTLRRLDCVEQVGGIRLEFEAESFLYKMVRNIVGTVLDVAQGKLAPQDILRILKARDRRKASKAAAAKGLFLVSVDY
ncbi:MAG: tRNA pseudouridine(38-40) synthase TruA [Chlamydiales bacterium]